MERLVEITTCYIGCDKMTIRMQTMSGNVEWNVQEIKSVYCVKPDLLKNILDSIIEKYLCLLVIVMKTFHYLMIENTYQC